jgi:murein DD-endopeptidase MepM/ murein hydrolase activator NlpD
MKLLLLTTEPQWKSWNKKLSALRGGIGLVKNLGSVQIDNEEYKGEILTVGNRIDRAWFNTFTLQAQKRGYHAVILHLGKSKAKSLGIQQNLRGITINDEIIGEMYVISDENDYVVYDDGYKVNRFIKVFLHEMSHWMAKSLGQEDKTHYWDYERHNILLAMTAYTYPKGFIDTILSKVRKERITSPIVMTKITQHFGVDNNEYASGIHAGTDIGVPVGTPVVAPTDGRVTLVWKDHKTLGNACLFEFYYNGKVYNLRCAHLNNVPKKGGYRFGVQFAQTGNTGMSTGPHLHLELWRGAYDVQVLYNKSKVLENLINPYLFFKNK